MLSLDCVKSVPGDKVYVDVLERFGSQSKRRLGRYLFVPLYQGYAVSPGLVAGQLDFHVHPVIVATFAASAVCATRA